jgi:subtilisin family serine protease
MFVSRHFYFILLALTAHVIIIPSAIGMISSGSQPPSSVEYEPRSIVIKFDQTALGRINRLLTRSGRTGIPAVDQLAQQFNAASFKRQFPSARKRFLRGKEVDLSGWHKIDFDSDIDIDNVVVAFKNLGSVLDAQPIGIHPVFLIPNDTSYINEWHLNQANDSDIDAPEAWDFETGNESIIVAVLDSGVRWFHKDLGGSDAVFFEPPGFNDDISSLNGADGNMWINGVEANGTFGVDDDGNGFTDDIIGWDFVDIPVLDALLWCNSFEDCLAIDNDPRDFHGHGTHVAGIIGALNNNGYAVSSAAGGWGAGTLAPSGDGVKIMSLRIGWANRSIPPLGYVSMFFAAQALRYAADNGAHIVNASWGSSNTGGLGEAVDYFLASGGMIFHAAGNSGTNSADYLGSRSDVVNVAATDQSDCKASFSNYGDWVDLAAPGVAIYSTWHRYNESSGDYVAALSGTSMASPMAASTAALIWSQNPSWSAGQIILKLLDSTDDIDGLGCNSTYTGQLGRGRINLYAAVGSCESDYDNNGVVDGSDLTVLAATFGCTGGMCPQDLTYDGRIDSSELIIFAKDFGRLACPANSN